MGTEHIILRAESKAGDGTNLPRSILVMVQYVLSLHLYVVGELPHRQQLARSRDIVYGGNGAART